MELYLQFGHGMMEHWRVLINSWVGGTVMLSPRDLDTGQLKRLGSEIASMPGGRCLIDPQFYLPYADHQKLCRHSYWPKQYETTLFWDGPGLVKLLTALGELNAEVGCSEVILPSLFAQKIDEDWLDRQRAIIEGASTINFHKPVVATIALSADAVRDPGQVSLLLEHAESWKPQAYYLVCEHPNGQYLVDDPNWLANVLDICAGLRLLGAKVILGYCTHQMLIAVAAKATAICSGTWMNVRSFPPEKFNTVYEDEIRTRATWYYAPHALSEYKLPFLDIAHRLDVLRLLAPPSLLDGGYVMNLFSGPQPSTVGFGEQSAFRHYLHALRRQVETVPAESFDAAVSGYEAMLAEVEPY